MLASWVIGIQGHGVAAPWRIISGMKRIFGAMTVPSRGFMRLQRIRPAHRRYGPWLRQVSSLAIRPAGRFCRLERLSAARHADPICMPLPWASGELQDWTIFPSCRWPTDPGPAGAVDGWRRADPCAFVIIEEVAARSWVPSR